MTDSLCVDKTCQITNMRLSCAQHIAHREKPSTGTSKQHMSQHKAGQGWRLEPALACSVPNVASPRSRGGGATKWGNTCGSQVQQHVASCRFMLALLLEPSLSCGSHRNRKRGGETSRGGTQTPRQTRPRHCCVHACMCPASRHLFACHTDKRLKAARDSRKSQPRQPRVRGSSAARVRGGAAREHSRRAAREPARRVNLANLQLDMAICSGVRAGSLNPSLRAPTRRRRTAS